MSALVLIVCHIYLSVMQNTAYGVVFVGALTSCLDKLMCDLDKWIDHAHQGHAKVNNFCFYQSLSRVR